MSLNSVKCPLDSSLSSLKVVFMTKDHGILREERMEYKVLVLTPSAAERKWCPEYLLDLNREILCFWKLYAKL